ncbi:hypothetical protein LBMAG52_36500 [Planctomycetia bacterium]|nr:hypothetical protein LBMAG52_36500 [Planctomycetia bacterium]
MSVVTSNVCPVIARLAAVGETFCSVVTSNVWPVSVRLAAAGVAFVAVVTSRVEPVSVSDAAVGVTFVDTPLPAADINATFSPVSIRRSQPCRSR